MEIKKMVSDRDCINLSDIAYLELSNSKVGRNLHDIFFEKTDENNYSPRDEFKYSQDSAIKKFMEQLKAFSHYYYPTLINYKLIATGSSEFTGYYGMACINDEGETVVANKGTSGLLDYLNDVFMSACKVPPQASSAYGLYRDAVKAAKRSSNFSGITLTGHSLGGSLATFQMLQFYGDGYLKHVKTFEEFGVLWCVVDTSKLGIAGTVDMTKVGISKNYFQHYHSWNKVKTAYRNRFDPIANTSMHIGRMVQLTGDSSCKINIDPDHTLSTYKIYALDNDSNLIPGRIDIDRFRELERIDPGDDDSLSELARSAILHRKQITMENNKLNEKNMAAVQNMLK